MQESPQETLHGKVSIIKLLEVFLRAELIMKGADMDFRIARDIYKEAQSLKSKLARKEKSLDQC